MPDFQWSGHSNRSRAARLTRGWNFHRQIIVPVIGAALLSACATTQHVASVTALKSTSGPLKIVMMPLDVQLSVLTAGGVLEPHSAWTEAAKANITSAVKNVEQTRQIEFLVHQQPAEADPDAARLHELEALNGAVGQAILFHKFVVTLPTKKDVFDWTLGSDVELLRNRTGADYALFIYMRDSYSSSGRIFLQFAAALVGIGLAGGQQIGFASLVDLQSGNVVWFNFLQSAAGDLRTPEPAARTIKTLLETLPR
ncbi:MAG: hypothetical protein HYR49_02800 [Gammaproteobacteria bacterium]|nr:hypothetical protein [Gammaproteobacteria bacterium]